MPLPTRAQAPTLLNSHSSAFRRTAASLWMEIVLSSGIASFLVALAGDPSIEDIIAHEHGKESYPDADLLAPSEHVMLASCFAWR